tara:strand:+ start:2011 stop:2439 length:429 start_codon:yes stop_codon:yes gene_type:complete
MPLPNDVLAKLAGLSGYDLILEMDVVSRTHGIQLAQIESEIASYKAQATSQGTSGVADFQPVSYKEEVDLSQAQNVQAEPKYISNPENYRMKYNPSAEGKANQSQVNQAIICPHCSSPLGIPNIRPIKVTCPSCFNEAVFHN